MTETADFNTPLYAARRNIYPQGVSGRFRTVKWIVLVVTLAIYYLLPFLRWDRGPNAPSQAVLADFEGRRFYFFFIEIWPQEVYYFAGLLIMAAMALFLLNAVAGRVWCGYLCPQTVWTDLFIAVERYFEGDRRERMIADAGRLTPRLAARKAAKHAVWLMIAWWTGGAWVLYFADAPTLVRQLATFQAPFLAWAWIGILTATTYFLAGWMREQVCIYMCPWPRIQAALIDEDALNVTYRYDRGEPRVSVKKAEVLRREGGKAGDCIDCSQCVHVCPTGVDIRKGLQLDCIQCGLCIDACDSIMTKIGRPTGLIAYDTDNAIKARLACETPRYRLVRPRTILYSAIIAAIGLFMAWTFLSRAELGLSSQHDRNPLFVTLSDGSIRNGYTLRVLNKALEQRSFRIEIFGVEGAQISAQGVVQELGARSLVLAVGPDQTREVKAFVAARRAALKGASTPIGFRLSDLDSGKTANVRDNFIGP